MHRQRVTSGAADGSCPGGAGSGDVLPVEEGRVSACASVVSPQLGVPPPLGSDELKFLCSKFSRTLEQLNDERRAREVSEQAYARASAAAAEVEQQLVARVGELTDQVADRGLQLRQLEEERERLRDELRSLQLKEAECAEVELSDAARAELGEVSRIVRCEELARQSGVVQQLQGQISVAEAEVAEWRERYGQSHGRVKELERTLAKEQQKLQECENAARRWQRELQAVRRRLRDASADVQKSDAQLCGAQVKVRDLDEQLVRFRGEAGRSEDLLRRLQAEGRDLEEAEARVKETASIAHEQAEHEKAWAEAEATVAGYEAEAAAAERAHRVEVEELRSQAQRFAAQLERKGRDAAAMEASLRDAYVATSEELKASREEANTVLCRGEGLQEEVSASQEANEKLYSELAEMRKQTNILRDSTVSHMQRAHGLRQRNTELEKRVEKAQSTGHKAAANGGGSVEFLRPARRNGRLSEQCPNGSFRRDLSVKQQQRVGCKAETSAMSKSFKDGKPLQAYLPCRTSPITAPNKALEFLQGFVMEQEQRLDEEQSSIKIDLGEVIEPGVRTWREPISNQKENWLACDVDIRGTGC